MGLFRKRENRAEGEAQFEDALLKALLGGVSVDKETALQVPTVSGGVDLIANIVAGTPIKLFRENDGKTEEVRDDYRIRLLNDETGDTLNANEFWKAIVRDYYVGKGGYAYINKERGRVKSLHYVDESRVSIAKNNDPIFKDFDIMVGGRAYKPYDFLKVLRNSKDGATGTPITEESSKLINVAYQSLCFEYNTLRKGGAKKGFLLSENRLGKEELAALREAYSRLYGSNSENMMVLNKGLNFQQLSDNAAEMQMNENKRTNAEEFAKIFHVSTGVMSGNATEADTASLAKLAAIPLMTTIQCALNKDFLLEKEKGEYYWAFDTKELLKGDMKERFEAYKTALDANFMQIDEVRYAEDMEPLGMTWVKLGLQDVLYDPKTKQIYTPNTDAWAEMKGEQFKQTEDNGTSESRAWDPSQPRDKKGRFSEKSIDKSGGSGIIKSSEIPTWDSKKAKEPFDYWELSDDKTGFPRRLKPKGFSHERTAKQHFNDHGKSVGANDVADYQQKAIDFMNSPRGKHGDAFVRKNGDVCRYDYDSKLFAAVTSDGTLKTFWNLGLDIGDSGADMYWRDQKNEE